MRHAIIIPMGNFNRDRISSGDRGFGRRGFGGRDRGGRPMLHKTVCSKCDKECEVPFRPTGNRPVFCRECFQTVKPSESIRPESNFPRRPNFENRSNQINRPIEQPNYKEQLEVLSAKLDKILKILEPKIITTTDSAESANDSKVNLKAKEAKPSRPKKSANSPAPAKKE